ncbi:hypothetical protein Bca4012_009810 [Brassica carinata]
MSCSQITNKAMELVIHYDGCIEDNFFFGVNYTQQQDEGECIIIYMGGGLN